MYISKILGLIPRITLKLLVQFEINSTTQLLSLILFNSCFLLMVKCFPNSPNKDIKNCRFTTPFSPTINVVGFLSSCISMKLFPVIEIFPSYIFKIIILKNSSNVAIRIFFTLLTFVVL